MASLRNPGPGHPHYLHDGAPGDCGIQAGQPPTAAIGRHPSNAGPPVQPKDGSGSDVYGAGHPMASISGSKPPQGPQHGGAAQPSLSGKANPSFGKPANRDARRGRPGPG